MGPSSHVSAARHTIHFPVNDLEKVAEYGSHIWAPATHMRDPDASPGSLLLPGRILVIAVTWGVQ